MSKSLSQSLSDCSRNFQQGQFLADLFQLILDLCNAGLCAGFLLGLAARCPTQADGTDRVVANHDRNSSAERNDIRETALTGYVAFCRAFRPIGGSPPERQSRVGLAAGELEIMRGCSIALEKYTQPAGTIQNRDRYSRRAFIQSCFRNRQGHFYRNIFLRKNLCSRRRGNCNEHGQTSHEAQSNRHRILPSAIDARLCHGFPILRCKTDLIESALQAARNQRIESLTVLAKTSSACELLDLGRVAVRLRAACRTSS